MLFDFHSTSNKNKKFELEFYYDYFPKKLKFKSLIFLFFLKTFLKKLLINLKELYYI